MGLSVLTQKKELLYSLFIICGLVLIVILFSVLYYENNKTSEGSDDVSVNDQSNISNVVSSTVLPSEYFIASYSEDENTSIDYFYNSSFDYRNYKLRNYKDLVFIMSGAFRDLYVFDKGGELVYRLKHNIPCSPAYKDYEIVGNSIFLVCKKDNETAQFPDEFLIKEVNLETGAVENIWSEADGLTSSLNIQLLSFNNALWVGNYEGVSRINLETNQIEKSFNEILTGYSNIEVDLHSNGTELWGTMGSNVNSAGGVAYYDIDADTWFAYKYNDFPNTDARIDPDSFNFVNNQISFIYTDKDFNQLLTVFDTNLRRWTHEKTFADYTESDSWRSDIYSKILLADNLKINSQTSQLYFLENGQELLTEYPESNAFGITKINDDYILFGARKISKVSGTKLNPEVIYVFEPDQEDLPFGLGGENVATLSDEINNLVYALSIEYCFGDGLAFGCEQYANLVEFDLNNNTLVKFPVDSRVVDIPNLRLKKEGNVVKVLNADSGSVVDEVDL